MDRVTPTALVTRGHTRAEGPHGSPGTSAEICAGGAAFRAERSRADGVTIQKVDQARERRVLGLAIDRHIPVLRTRKTLLEIAGCRRRMRLVMPGDDVGANIELHEIL